MNNIKPAGSDPRVCALLITERIQKDKAFSNIVLGQELERAKLSTQDRSFLTALVYGVIERRRTIEYILSKYIKTAPVLRASEILALGVCQIMFMDKIPESAAVNESVKLAKKFLSEREAWFINAILRGVCHDREAIAAEIPTLPDGIRYSLSDSVCALIREQYLDCHEKIFESFFKIKELSLCVNTNRISLAGLKEIFKRAGVDFVLDKSGGFIIKTHAQKVLRMLPEGLFFVQGASSRRAVELLDISENQLLIDTCACPGGKTLNAAVKMRNRGRIIALDLHENKLPLIEKSAELLGIKIITTAGNDARKSLPE